MEQATQIPGLSSRAVNSVRAFVQMINGWRNKAADGIGGLLPMESAPSAHTTVQALMEDVVRRSGLEAYYKKEGGDEQSELANIDQLITSAAEFDKENDAGTLDEYLSMISLVSDIDHMKGNGGAITMMTLHSAKGLEFPVVAMIGLEEGCLPHARARDSMDQMEEERRLCFVGITRAEERLILTKAGYRTIRGLRERTVTSPFLSEMPAEDLEIIDRTGLPNSYARGEFRTESRKNSEFKKGQLVRHPTFGIGRISDITEGSNARAIIQFNQVGQKTLVLEFARLEAVG
jgi:DNA helicase-2/ATP-dependent DNA helicase PcrA